MKLNSGPWSFYLWGQVNIKGSDLTSEAVTGQLMLLVGKMTIHSLFLALNPCNWGPDVIGATRLRMLLVGKKKKTT